MQTWAQRPSGAFLRSSKAKPRGCASASTSVCEGVAMLSLRLPAEVPPRGCFQRSQDSAVAQPTG
jgi:hypothetical protein